jgi:hypothetical protein
LELINGPFRLLVSPLSSHGCLLFPSSLFIFRKLFFAMSVGWCNRFVGFESNFGNQPPGLGHKVKIFSGWRNLKNTSLRHLILFLVPGKYKTHGMPTFPISGGGNTYSLWIRQYLLENLRIQLVLKHQNIQVDFENTCHKPIRRILLIGHFLVPTRLCQRFINIVSLSNPLRLPHRCRLPSPPPPPSTNSENSHLE